MPPRPAIAAVLLALAVTLGACSDGLASGDPGDGGKSTVLGDADEGIDGVQSIRVYYANPVHVGSQADVDYELRPPAGGIHAPIWWNCGFYVRPVRDENAVHDLEHGVVWLAYSPQLDERDVEVLHDIARENDKVLVAPYRGLDVGVAVVATAGRVEGGFLNLGIAPMLFVAMVFLVWAGPGALSTDRRLFSSDRASARTS